MKSAVWRIMAAAVCAVLMAAASGCSNGVDDDDDDSGSTEASTAENSISKMDGKILSTVDSADLQTSGIYYDFYNGSGVSVYAYENGAWKRTETYTFNKYLGYASEGLNKKIFYIGYENGSYYLAESETSEEKTPLYVYTGEFTLRDTVSSVSANVLAIMRRILFSGR